MVRALPDRAYILDRSSFQPAYLRLKKGELRRRAEAAVAALADCTLCPRDCCVNRLEDKKAVCRTGRHAMVSSYGPHFGEENCLRGRRGSGTIFFTWCNLRCVFCQNWETSHVGDGRETPPEELARMMLLLQEQGCHNLNLVTPSHVVPQILEALVLAAERGLRLPLVYNTSGYDAMESLRLLDGVVDIYMPDFKYWDAEAATRYSKAADYAHCAREALREMHRQVGPLTTDEDGVALRGVLLRHLVMPGAVAGTAEIMRWVARELSTDTYVNLMPQYYPAGLVDSDHFPEIHRCPSREEFRAAVQAARDTGLWRLDERSAACGFMY